MQYSKSSARLTSLCVYVQQLSIERTEVFSYIDLSRVPSENGRRTFSYHAEALHLEDRSVMCVGAEEN